MRKCLIAAIAALGLAATQAQAAKSGVKLGVLSCDVAGGIGLIIGSSKPVDCAFKSAKGHIEHYSGHISKLGIDIGITNDAVIAWAVFAPGKVKPGGLEGSYAGAAAEATVVAGLGAHVLIGGFKKTINLQPISVQAQTGLNVAAGIEGLQLDYEGQ